MYSAKNFKGKKRWLTPQQLPPAPSPSMLVFPWVLAFCFLGTVSKPFGYTLSTYGNNPFFFDGMEKGGKSSPTFCQHTHTHTPIHQTRDRQSLNHHSVQTAPIRSYRPPGP
jgi:hypothetical protein